MRVSTAPPDLSRTDAGLAVSSEWVLATPARQRAAAEAIVEAWTGEPWPDGLLAHAIYLDTDGDLLRHYAQWTDEAAYEAFVRAGGQPGADRIEAAVPGVVGRDLARYRIYRGTRNDDGRVPGAMVAVRVDTEGPEHARTWVDAVFTALEADPDRLPEGGIGAFFHVSDDGRQVLNYAEWVSAEAHVAALAANGNSIAQGPHWDRVQRMEGVRQVSVKRYHPHATLTPDP